MNQRIVLADGLIDARCGDWRDVLADVGECDAVITDAPFSERTHGGQRHGRKDERYGKKDGSQRLSHRGIGYQPWTENEARAWAAHWCARSRGWVCTFTSHDLINILEESFRIAHFTLFAPLACTQLNRNVRLAGDGHANWTDWLMAERPLVVARPRSKRWRALCGAYVGSPVDNGENALDRSKRAVAGAKPLWLMRRVLRDHARAGDLVVDTFGGGMTTALACVLEGCSCVVAERDPETFALGVARLRTALAAIDALARQRTMLDAAQIVDEGQRQRRAKAMPLGAACVPRRHSS